MIKLAYRYDKLDKVHEYQIENDGDIFHQWVWFYLGKKLKEKKRESIIPYHFNPTKKLYESDTSRFSAKEIAEFIYKAIARHRKIRKIK